MARCLVSDAHECINNIFPLYISTIYRNHSQGNGLGKSAGKEEPVDIYSSLPL